jgi:hypothetical protein
MPRAFLIVPLTCPLFPPAVPANAKQILSRALLEFQHFEHNFESLKHGAVQRRKVNADHPKFISVVALRITWQGLRLE